MDVPQQLAAPHQPKSKVVEGTVPGLNLLQIERMGLDLTTAESFLFVKEIIVQGFANMIRPVERGIWPELQEKLPPHERRELSGIRDDAVRLAYQTERLAGVTEEKRRENKAYSVADIVGNGIYVDEPPVPNRSIASVLVEWEALGEKMHDLNMRLCDNFATRVAAGKIPLSKQGILPEDMREHLTCTHNLVQGIISSLRFDARVPCELGIHDLRAILFKNICTEFEDVSAPVPVIVDERAAVFMLRRINEIIMRAASSAHERAFTEFFNSPTTYAGSNPVFESRPLYDCVESQVFGCLEMTIAPKANGTVEMVMPVHSSLIDKMTPEIERLQREIDCIQKIGRQWNIYIEHELQLAPVSALKATIYFPKADIERTQMPADEVRPASTENDAEVAGEDRSDVPFQFMRTAQVGAKTVQYTVSTIWAALENEDARKNLFQAMSRCDALVAAEPRFSKVEFKPPIYDEDENAKISKSELFDGGEFCVVLMGDKRKTWRQNRTRSYDSLYTPFSWDKEVPRRPEELWTPRGASEKLGCDEMYLQLTSETVLNDPIACAKVARILKLATPIEFYVELDGRGDHLGTRLMHQFLSDFEAKLRTYREAYGSGPLYFSAGELEEERGPASDYVYAVKLIEARGRTNHLAFFSHKEREIELHEYDATAAREILDKVPQNLAGLDPNLRASFRAIDGVLQRINVVAAERFVEAMREERDTLPKMDSYTYYAHLQKQVEDYLCDPLVRVTRSVPQTGKSQKILIRDLCEV